MNIQLLTRTISTKGISLFSKLLSVEGTRIPINRNFHFITQTILPKTTLPSTVTAAMNNTNNMIINNLRQPSQTQIWFQKCGLKYKVALSLRCKDCYFFWVDGRKFVRCKTHPRHKQAQIVKKECNTWITTSVCQHKIRPWVNTIQKWRFQKQK